MGEVKTETVAVPAASLNGVTFWPIPEFNPSQSLFGMPANAYFRRGELPEIPEEFTAKASKLFFYGNGQPDFPPEVDPHKAMAAIRAWLCSFAPPHEAKIATVAYALWVWTTPEALVEPKADKPAVRKTHHKGGRRS